MSNTVSTISATLAEQLIGGGVAISFKEGSTLEVAGGELNRVMEPIEVESLESLVVSTNKRLSATEANPFTTSFEETNVLGNSAEIASEAVINDIVPIAQGIIGKVRNLIIPATNEIFQRAYDATSDEVDRGGILVNIRTDGSEKEIWSNPALLSLLAAHAESGDVRGGKVCGITFPPLPFETLLSYIHQINPVLNPSINSLLGDEADSIVTNVYQYVFNVQGQPCDVAPRTQYLISFLLALALKENIPEGVVGVDDAGQYRAALDKVADSNAALLRQQIEHSVQLTRSGRLIISFPAPGTPLTRDSVIVVNGGLYESWLEAGGSVDAILGAYASRNQPTNGAEILENKPQLERDWIRHVGLAQSTIRDDFQRVYVNRLRGAIHDYADEVKLKVSSEAIDRLYDPNVSVDPDNAYTFTREAVVDSLFDDNDDCNAVLNEIDAISVAVPGISLEDATDLGIIDWLSGWALKQVKVNKRSRE